MMRPLSNCCTWGCNTWPKSGPSPFQSGKPPSINSSCCLGSGCRCEKSYTLNVTASRIGAPLNDPAAELDFLVGVIQRDDGQPDPRIARRVLGLECALACADEDRVALEVDPHRSNLRRPIAHQCREVGEVGATD